MSPTPTQTPLTEQQARSLALWWGGAYQCLRPDAPDRSPRHGVVLARPSDCCPAAEDDSPIQVFSLEEAQALENRRGFQEACSPDWVG